MVRPTDLAIELRRDEGVGHVEWAGLAGSPTSKGGLRRGARVQESGAVQELFSGETYLDIPLRGAILHTTRLGILWIALHVQVVVRKAVKTNGVLGLIGRDMACPSGQIAVGQPAFVARVMRRIQAPIVDATET